MSKNPSSEGRNKVHNAGPPLARVPRVQMHPSILSIGCQAPVLKSKWQVCVCISNEIYQSSLAEVYVVMQLHDKMLKNG